MTVTEFLANPDAALEAAEGATVELTEGGKVVACISVPRDVRPCEWTDQGRGVVP